MGRIPPEGQKGFDGIIAFSGRCEWVDEAKREKLRTNKYGPLLVILASPTRPDIVVEFVRHTESRTGKTSVFFVVGRVVKGASERGQIPINNSTSSINLWWAVRIQFVSFKDQTIYICLKGTTGMVVKGWTGARKRVDGDDVRKVYAGN